MRIALVYAALAVAYTWPVARHMASRVPNDLGDSLLNMFIMAWNTRAVPLTAEWWNMPQFFPAPGATAFSEHLVGFMPLANPVIWVTGSPLLAYNLLFILSYALCGIAAHALVKHLTRRDDAALVAGIAFAFAPYRLTQLAHLQVLAAFWLPAALLCLHRFIETRRTPWAVLFALSWLMQALTCGYYVFYFSLLAGLWLLWFAIGPRALPWRQWVTLGGAWAGAALLFLPFALGYRQWQQMYGMRRTLTEIKVFSGDVAGILTAPRGSWLWDGLEMYPRAESELFTGVTVVLLVIAGIVLGVRAANSGMTRTRRSAALLLLALSLAAATAWLAYLVSGPIELKVAGGRLLSIRSPGRPLLVALAAGIAAIALTRACGAAFRTRSPLFFYTAASVCMAIFALGPDPTIAGRDMRVPGPYSLLLLLPGTDGVRVPARFWMLTALCLAAAAGLASARMASRWPRAARAVVPLAAALIALEGWPSGVTMHAPPALAPAAATTGARLQLPMWKDGDIAALYRAIFHGRPSINGYSGYFPQHYEPLTIGLSRRDPLIWDALPDEIEVAVERARDADGAWRQYIERTGRARIVHEDAAWMLFAVAPGQDMAAACSGTRAPIRGASASLDGAVAAHAIDGSPATRWHSGHPQKGGEELVLDLGAARDLRALGLPLHDFRDDFARDLAISISSDGAVWTEVRRSQSNGPYIAAALKDLATLPLCYPLAGHARYIRLTQLGTHPTFYWSVPEVIVYANR